MFAGALLLVETAYAQQPVSGSIYRLTPVHSAGLDRTLQPQGGGTADGTLVQQQTWSNINSQKWVFTDLGDGYWRISPLHATDKALRVDGSGDESNVMLQAYGSGGDDRQWQLVNVGGNDYQFRPRNNSGMCLDIFGVSTENGAQVIIWGCKADTSTNQHFRLTEVESAGPIHRLMPRHSGKALDVFNCQTGNGTNVQQWSWLSNDCQRWQFTLGATAGGIDYWRITPMNALAQNRALRVVGTASGSNVTIETYGGQTDRQWQRVPVDGVWYQLRPRNNANNCLTIVGASTADGANANVATCVAGNHNQHFGLTNIIPSNLGTSTKSVVDLNGGAANPGDTLRYTITIKETAGVPANGVSVADTISGLLTGFNVVSIPSGATNNSTPGTGPLNVSNISVPASGSVTIVFDVTISGSANPGNTINNTANITNPATGVETNAVAPSVTVAASIPASGRKNLYPYFTGTFANQLRRVVAAPTNTTSGNINGGGVALTMNMTPSTQGSLTLGTGTIPVSLCMQRVNNTSAVRDVSVALSYVSTGAGGSAGTIGNRTLTGILGATGNPWTQVIFNIDPVFGSPVTLNPNTAIRMVVTNNTTTGTDRQIAIRSLGNQGTCNTNSHIGLNANTVIKVDSVDAYNAAYPAGGIIDAVAPGATVWLRAVVSDPFGSFDITGATIEILNPMGTVVIPSTAMTQVNDSGSALKTYQYAYTTPGAGPLGWWSARVTANEGTEGTITDLGVSMFQLGQPADLAISKTHSGDFIAGQQGVYTIAVNNNGPNPAVGVITVTDTLPAGLSYVSAIGTDWSCGAVGQDVTCTHPGPLANGDSLPDIALTANVSVAAAPSVTNTATVSNATLDNVPGNNSASDPTNVLVPNLTTSTKTVVDLNGGDANPGDTLRYTITINETAGAPVDGVSVTDTISGFLTGFTVVSIPPGATNSSTPGSGPLNISNISVPASGSVTIVFDANVLGSANPGNTINNTANITNPVNSVVTNAVAPPVIVAESSMPSSGVKNLYPYFNNNTLSRVEPPSNTISATIAGNNGNVILNMNPPTQSALTLGSGVIPVSLCMQRTQVSGIPGLLTPGNRTVTVALSYVGGSSGSIGSQQLSGILTSTGWQQVSFNINLGSNVTLNSNTQIRLTVTNNSSIGTLSTPNIEVRSLATGACTNGSFVGLNANTVINVDSVDAYNAAYPGGSIVSAVAPGATVWLRSVISDPFGSFDITGANIDILDSNGNTVVSAAAMTQVNDSGGALKTYQYAYTTPGAGPIGFWTARVTGIEGTEGTVTDLGVGAFQLGAPNISVMKLVSTVFDPVNNTTNPKAIPGAIVEYQIIATNSGVGMPDANSIAIAVPLDSGLQFFFGHPSPDPVQFIDGATSSGLSYTFTSLASTSDDIAFSNNGGSTFITPSVDANGFDITAPPINFIRINPQGVFSPSNGVDHPNFSLRFRARVQ